MTPLDPPAVRSSPGRSSLFGTALFVLAFSAVGSFVGHVLYFASDASHYRTLALEAQTIAHDAQSAGWEANAISKRSIEIAEGSQKNFDRALEAVAGWREVSESQARVIRTLQESVLRVIADVHALDPQTGTRLERSEARLVAFCRKSYELPKAGPPPKR